MSEKKPAHEVIITRIKARADSLGASQKGVARGVSALREEALEDLGGMRELLHVLNEMAIPYIALDGLIRELRNVPGQHAEVAETIANLQGRKG
jgi:hypothetical protein